MKIWNKPQVREQEVGLEVTSYLPAENRHHLTVDPLLTADRKAPWALKVRGAFFAVSSRQNEAG